MKRKDVYDDEAELKRCSVCESWKPFSLFSASSGAKSAKGKVSLQAYCRPCSLLKSNSWAANNADKKQDHRRAQSDRLGYGKRIVRPDLPLDMKLRKATLRKEWGDRNHKTVLLWNRLRRIRERAGGRAPKRSEIFALGLMQSWLCIYCRTDIGKAYHIDHKTPVSRGGTNCLGNLQLLCPQCNLRKGARTHDEFSAIRMLKLTEFDLLAVVLEQMECAA